MSGPVKKALIIGATSGIGRSLAETLLREDYTVGVTGRREDLLKSLQEKYPGKIITAKMDVRDPMATAAGCAELAKQMGGLDLLIIAAGIGEGNKDLDLSIEQDVIKTNVEGFTSIAAWGMSFFKKQGHGHLVNISSVAGIRGNGVAPSYNASKAFQINYLEGLSMNAHRSKADIHVTDVRPGFVDTAMAKGDGLFWVTPVEKAASQIHQAIKRKKRVVYISKRWWLIGRLLRLLPYSILRRF